MSDATGGLRRGSIHGRRRRRRLSVYLDRRDAWVGAFRDHGVFYWCPIPFLVVRWEGDPRGLGVTLALSGLLSQILGPPWPVSGLIVLWLVWPGAAGLWWSWREYQDGAISR